MAGQRKQLVDRYQRLCFTQSDINQHLPTLSRYASKCEVVLEAGVRAVCSTWAFIHGLTLSTGRMKKLYSVDIQSAPIEEAIRVAGDNGVSLNFTKSDIFKFELPEKVDLTFIDTFHCYGQLKRELVKLAPFTTKYIIMHDTTVDGVRSEALRCNYDVNKLENELGWSRKDLITGLWPAVEEFLRDNADWKLHHRFLHNNGLTILKRRN